MEENESLYETGKNRVSGFGGLGFGFCLVVLGSQLACIYSLDKGLGSTLLFITPS